jgi:uncharacterized Zn-finger protein
MVVPLCVTDNNSIVYTGMYLFRWRQTIHGLEESLHEVQVDDNGNEVPVNEKTHLCGHCGKTFQTSSGLTRHEQGHTREKPYTCDIYGMQFNERGHFQGHFNSHAKMKSCKCDKCGKSYQYRSSLLRHTLSCNGLEVNRYHTVHKHKTKHVHYLPTPVVNKGVLGSLFLRFV